MIGIGLVLSGWAFLFLFLKGRDTIMDPLKNVFVATIAQNIKI
jgi:hypothetical protein